MWLYRQPELCGLLLYDYAWFNTGGYAYLHRPVPMYQWADHSPGGRARALAAAQRAANYVLLRRASFSDFEPGYTLRHCDLERGAETMCVAARPDRCIRTPGLSAVQ